MFRKSLTITRNTVKLVKGVYTNLTPTTLVIIAGVQTLSTADIQALEQIGRQTKGSVKVYTNSELKIAEQGTDQKGDTFVWNGRKYEVVTKDIFDNNILPHKRYIAELRDE